MFVYRDPPRGMGRLIQDAWSLYKSTLLNVVFLSALTALLTLLVENLQREWMLRMIHLNQQVDLVVLLMVVAIIFVMFFTLFVAIVILRYMDALARDQAARLKKAIWFACSWVRIFTLFRAMALLLLMLAVGFALFVLPGIILLAFIALVMPLVVVREDKALAAIKHSFQYVWGNWWYTIGLIMTPVAAALVLAFLVDRLVVDTAGRMIVDLVLSSVLTPWLYATQLVLLHELSWRHEQVYEP
jgi:hypothetical protein